VSVHLAVLVPFGAGRRVVSRALGVQASVYNVNAKNWIALLRICGGYRTLSEGEKATLAEIAQRLGG
jgi:hypothetical protein